MSALKWSLRGGNLYEGDESRASFFTTDIQQAQRIVDLLNRDEDLHEFASKAHGEEAWNSLKQKWKHAEKELTVVTKERDWHINQSKVFKERAQKAEVLAEEANKKSKDLQEVYDSLNENLKKLGQAGLLQVTQMSWELKKAQIRIRDLEIELRDAKVMLDVRTSDLETVSKERHALGEELKQFADKLPRYPVTSTTPYVARLDILLARYNELQKVAELLEAKAEKLKHTSHKDGIGFGWVEGEDLLKETAAEIVDALTPEEVKRIVEASDVLHPNGRCTCAGEGKCEWCQRLCPTCGGEGTRPDNEELFFLSDTVVGQIRVMCGVMSHPWLKGQDFCACRALNGLWRSRHRLKNKGSDTSQNTEKEGDKK